MPTFAPGWKVAPRCRTMIVPALIACPSPRLTPSRLTGAVAPVLAAAAGLLVCHCRLLLASARRCRRRGVRPACPSLLSVRLRRGASSAPQLADASMASRPLSWPRFSALGAWRSAPGWSRGLAGALWPSDGRPPRLLRGLGLPPCRALRPALAPATFRRRVSSIRTRSQVLPVPGPAAVLDLLLELEDHELGPSSSPRTVPLTVAPDDDRRADRHRHRHRR